MNNNYYLSLRVIRISIISIIACDFNNFESFDQPLAAIVKNGCHGHQGLHMRWPNIHFCSQDIYQYICLIWCLYHKINNLICWAMSEKMVLSGKCFINSKGKFTCNTSVPQASPRLLWEALLHGQIDARRLFIDKISTIVYSIRSPKQCCSQETTQTETFGFSQAELWRVQYI